MDDYHKWIAFTEEQIDEIIREFSGIKIDPTTGQQYQAHEPLMNEKGIATTRILLRSVLHLNTILSNLSKGEFRKTFFYICADFLNTILINKDEYQIKLDKIQLIMAIFMNYTEFTLRRAINQGEREFVKATLQAKRNVVEGQALPSTIPYQVGQEQTQDVGNDEV